MKKTLFLILVFASISFAQLKLVIVGDTTELKQTQGDLALLRQFGNSAVGGGLFERIDSSYAEGVDAFNHPYPGSQWARIKYYEFVEKFISSPDTTSLTTDSTFYTINGFTSSHVIGVASTDSSVTLGSDAYYDFQANFSYKATDSVSYKIALFKNNTIDTTIQKDFDMVDNDSTKQNLSLSGIVKSDGNDVFKIKVEIKENQTSKEFIIYQANVKFIKIK